MSDHRAARNRLAIEANHFGLDADTAARLAARAESMGLLSDQMPEIDALETLAHMSSVYRLEARHAPGSDNWWFLHESSSLKEVQDFMEINEQAKSIPAEDKRIVEMHYTRWFEVIDGE